MRPEIHLFIIWSHAAPFTQQIIEDINSKFTIKKAFQVYWDPSHYSTNISRFYGQSLPPGCEKEIHCGTGPFTLIIVQDEKPVYALRYTSNGECEVNINTFDAKQVYRSWTGGGHRIHATNSLKETTHDLALLLGCGIDAFVAFYPENWDGCIQILLQNLIGTNGWQSIQQLFAVLNLTSNYVVLRNFECLPDQYHLELHGDIDLLTNDATELVYISNAVKVFQEDYRVHYQVNIDGKPVLFDFRYIGDGYYDDEWERFILRNREFSPRNFFTPNQEDYFYSLIYHALVHKPTIAKDYIERLLFLASRLNIADFSYQTLTDSSLLKLFLDSYMNKMGFRYTVPKDLSVFFHKNIF